MHFLVCQCNTPVNGKPQGGEGADPKEFDNFTFSFPL